MKKVILSLIMTSLGWLPVCGVPDGRRTGENDGQIMPQDKREEGVHHKITAEQAKAIFEEDGVTVVDVWTREEYVQAHIPGACLSRWKLSEKREWSNCPIWEQSCWCTAGQERAARLLHANWHGCGCAHVNERTCNFI